MSSLVLLGTVGSDVHSVANTLLEKALNDSGYAVQNLGVAVPDFEWIEFTKSLNPDLVLIGSMNGDLLPLTNVIKTLLNYLPAWKIVVGGKLNLGSDGLSSAPFIKAMGISVLDDDEVTFEEIIKACTKILRSNLNLNLKTNNASR